MIDVSTASACGALLTAAGPLDWTELTHRLGPDATAIVRYGDPLPDGLVEAVFASGDGALLGALAGNQNILKDAPALMRRLAGTGRPEVVEEMYGVSENRWTPPMRRLALSALDPEDAGTGQVARKVLYHQRGRTSTVELVLAAHKLCQALGPEAAREELPDSAVSKPWNGYAPNWSVVEAAVRDGLDRGDLADVLADEEGTPGLVRKLRALGDDKPSWAGLYESIEWAGVLDAHAEDAFGDPAVAFLLAREDCPPRAIDAFYATNPAATAEHARAVGPELWELPTSVRLPVKAVRTLVVRLAGRRASLFGEARPATLVLEALRGRPEGTEDVFEVLRERVAPFGADIAGWATLRARLKNGKGTVDELFADVAKALAEGKVHKGVFPTAGRPAFVALLDAAPAETHLALLPLLDDKTVKDLFAHAAWRPEWLAFALASDDRRYRDLLTDRADMSADTIQALLDTGDTALVPRLFKRKGLTRAQRDRILTGPLDAAHKTELLAKTGGWHGRDVVAAADPELRRHVLRHVRVRGLVPQARVLLEVWTHEGRAEAQGLAAAGQKLRPAAYSANPFGQPAVRLMKRLSTMDDDVALRELRELVENGETPEWQLAELRRDRTDHADFTKGSHAWHWDAILASHQEDPLPEGSVWALARTPGCPEELRAEGEAIVPPWEREEAERRAARTLRGEELDRVLETERVAHTIRHLSRSPDAQAALTRVIRKTLDDGGSLDTWVLALRMLKDFTGTLPQLLRTTAAVTWTESSY